MKFRVTIKSLDRHAVDMGPTEIGLHALDRVRSELRLPNMPAKVLSSTIGQLNTDVLIEIDEDLARMAGCFDAQCDVDIIVPTGFLNTFVDTNVVAPRNNDGDVPQVYIERTVNESHILTAWCEAGSTTRRRTASWSRLVVKSSARSRDRPSR